MTSEILPDEKEHIFALLSGTVDWEYLVELADFHGVTPLLANNLINDMFSDRIPESYLKTLKRIYKRNLYINMITSNELNRVFSVFNQHEVDAIALKGTTLAEQLYGNLALRTVTDIDILVRLEQLSRAGSLLLEMGYEKAIDKYAKNHPFHEAYHRGKPHPSYVELHWNLDNQKLVSIPHDQIWKRAQPEQLNGCVATVLSPEDTLLFLCNNFSKQASQWLKSLCDIKELLKKRGSTLDWQYVTESACAWGVANSVYYSLKFTKHLLGATVSSSIIETLKPSIWRRSVLNFLISRQTLVSPIKWKRVRNVTSELVHGLMMKHIHQTLTVLYISWNPDKRKRTTWFTIILWIILIFGITLGRNITRIWFGGKQQCLTLF